MRTQRANHEVVIDQLLHDHPDRALTANYRASDTPDDRALRSGCGPKLLSTVTGRMMFIRRRRFMHILMALEKAMWKAEDLQAEVAFWKMEAERATGRAEHAHTRLHECLEILCAPRVDEPNDDAVTVAKEVTVNGKPVLRLSNQRALSTNSRGGRNLH